MNRLHTVLPLRHPHTALTRTHKRYMETRTEISNISAVMHTYIQRHIQYTGCGLNDSDGICSLSLSFIVRLCYRGNRVEDERRRELEWGGRVERGEDRRAEEKRGGR